MAVSLCTAMTLAGRRPSAANGSKAAAQLGSQPRAWMAVTAVRSVTVVGSVTRSVSGAARPLQLAGAPGISLSPREGPQAERDEHDAEHDQRPDVGPELGDRRALDQAGPDTGQDIGRRRQAR